MSDLKTPDEWCRVEGVQILDPDGWRGRHGRPWTDRITLAEFQDRLATCTQRQVPKASSDDREPFREARSAGLEKRHERRLENATYTAAEVKVLTEAALRLGRKEALEEAEAAADDLAAGVVNPEKPYNEAFIHACGCVARAIHNLASQPAPDASEPRTDPSMGMGPTPGTPSRHRAAGGRVSDTWHQSGATSSRSIAFWQKGTVGRPYLIASVADAPDSPVRLIRPYPDGSGDEELAVLTPMQWSEMVGFLGPILNASEHTQDAG